MSAAPSTKAEPLTIVDPLQFKEKFWPHVHFYRQQKEAIYSVVENDETYLPAGNMLGKDFVAAFVVLYYFLSRHPCRVVTTSAKEDHLRVLWGEIGQFIDTCKYPLDVRKGGPLVINHQELRKVVKGRRCPKSYVKGLVAGPDSIAAMQGHHIAKTGDGIPRTLFISDESSSVPDDYYRMASTWANRMLVIGNTWPCDNYFKRGVKGGDQRSEDGSRCYRKVIHIRATDSPNVRLALAQISNGKEPTGELLIPGVKDWEEYQKNLATWDKIQQCVSLNAEFYEGAELLLFPQEWLDRAERINDEITISKGRSRQAKAIGIDPAEGGDKTAMAAVDEYGILELISKRTPDTSCITGEAIAFGRKHKVDAENWVFDRGGGGKQHADALRQKGYKVRTVAFGEAISLDPRRGLHQLPVRMDTKEDRYTYKNRRAEMYHELRQLLDPAMPGWGIPREYVELRKQLSPMPLLYDPEGRIEMLPKNKKNEDDTKMTLVQLIGHSPDEADSVVLAVHGMLHKPPRSKAGVS